MISPKSKRWLKLLIIFVVLASAIYFISKATIMKPKTTEKQVKIQIIKDEPSVKDEIDEIIDLIAWEESRRNPNAINYHDGTYGDHSYGELMFKLRTFKWAMKRYLGVVLDDEEALLIIKDRYLQRFLARKMIEEGRCYHWTRASLKLGLSLNGCKKTK